MYTRGGQSRLEAGKEGKCECVCVCVCMRGLACELGIEVNDQRVVPPVKGGEQMKETQEAHLRRAEEGREIHSRDPLIQQRDVNMKTQARDTKGVGPQKKK